MGTPLGLAIFLWSVLSIGLIVHYIQEWRKTPEQKKEKCKFHWAMVKWRDSFAFLPCRQK